MMVDELKREIRAEFPGFKLAPKGGSRLMKTIGWFLTVLSFGTSKKFMEMYTTTIGTTVYTPLSWNGWTEHEQMALLRHERVHMRQARRLGRVWYALLYLFVPLPFLLAYFRMRFEREAYAETIRAWIDYGGALAVTRSEIDWVVGHFTGPAYLWMWPFKASLRAYFEKVAEEARNGQK